MHVATTILLLLFITTLSLPLARLVRIPLPLLQIALGVGAGFAGIHVSFEPDVFLLLFIPPLLFADAYLMPMREFLALKRVILMLALGLVLFTTIGCGYFVHWLIPPIPLAACFALAAVLSPTDAVAVAGMIEGRPVPRRFMHILSGEALLNDASGLVCFKFAVAAAVTGSFSFGQAVGAFVVMSCIGLLAGAALAAAMSIMIRVLNWRGFDNAMAFVTISALLPFAAYLAAEHLGGSGILAAVSAGLTLKQMRAFNVATGETRLGASAVWNLLTFSFNGLIFLLLGLQLPALIRSGLALVRNAGVPAWRLLWTIVLITLAVVLLRFIWVTTSLLLRQAVQQLRKALPGKTPRPPTPPSARLVVAMSVAGVRGAITLAAVLSLSPDFPERDLLVTLAAGVIVASLLLAALTLPALLTGLVMPDVDPMQAEVDRTRLVIAQIAVEAAERELALPDEHPHPEEREAVVSEVLAGLRAREQLLRGELDPNDADDDNDERRLRLRRNRLETAFRLRILRVKRDALTRMSRSAEINDETERALARELDYQEEVLSAVARSLPRHVREDVA